MLICGKTLMVVKKPPPLTPADMLRIELEKRNLSQRALARILGGSWSAPKVNEIILGKRGISESSALDLEDVLGIPAENWLKCQMERRLWEIREKKCSRK